MCISILFPVVANAIRVFGIILTGYLTDMEHAAGADHLIYGWIFFALVIVCLLGIGELLREKHLPEINNQNEVAYAEQGGVKTYFLPLVSILVLMLLFFAWFNVINGQLNQSKSSLGTTINLGALLGEDFDQSANKHTSTWKPEFNQPYQEWQFHKDLNGETVDVYMVWYPSGHGELINSLNRLYPEKAWTLDSKSTFALDDGQIMDLSIIVNPRNKRLLSYWYVIDGKLFTNNQKAKIYETYKILMGSYVGSGLIAISQTTDNVSVQKDIVSFSTLTQDNIELLSQYFAIK
jgi:EpsI family protein